MNRLAGFASAQGDGQSQRRLTAADIVYRDLRARIISLELPPNTPLSRHELAGEYGVSQTPVREALLHLQHEGLVDIYPQSRTVVSRIDVRELHEIHFLRAALEVETVRRLAAEGTDVTAAANVLTRQKEVVAGAAMLDEFGALDRQFHRALFEAVGQPGLIGLIEERSGHLDRVRRLHLPSTGKVAQINSGHDAVLAAVRSRDPDRAGQAMRDHLADTITSVDMMVAADPDYFTGV